MLDLNRRRRHTKAAYIRDCVGMIRTRKGSNWRGFTLVPGTKEMTAEAVPSPLYHTPGWNKDFPKLQILTVEDLLNGKQVQLPPSLHTFKQAERVNVETNQHTFEFE